MRFSVIAALVLALAVAGATPAGAQSVSATTGSINGKVTDTSGGVMPGVTVTITSPSMQGVLTATTNEDGNYRFPAVPPGTYKITYELVGFSPIVRDDIRISMGFTGTVNVEMKVGGLEESVTVSGESPVVDVQSTRTVTTFDAKTLAALPSARDMWSVLAESPAVSMTRIDVGGSTAGTQSGYTVYDAQGGQARIMNDGLNTTEGNNAIGVYVDYGAFDEIATETAGHAAEFSEPGVVTQFIAKTGGNAYHGLVYGDYQNKNVQSVNVDDAQATKISGAKPIPGFDYSKANQLESYWDFNIDIGGYIVKDKAWWYASYRNFDVKSRLANFPAKPFQTGTQHYTGKGTFVLPGNNKLIVYNQQTRKYQPNRLDAYAVSNAINETELTTESQTHWAWVRKVEWNKVVNSSTYAEVRGGTFGYDWPLVYQDAAKGIPRVEDSATLVVTGANMDRIQSRDRHQVLGSVSYFKENMGGDHNFKVGGEIFDETYQENYYENAYGNETISVLNNGRPTRVDVLEIPSEVKGGLWTYGAYINDTWRVSKRLTLVPGLRFTRYRQYLPAQEHPAGRYNPVATQFAEVKNVISWNNLAPRLGMTYDLMGNGKTVVKGNFSQYWYNPSVLTNINENKSPWYKRYNWTNDANGNGRWDKGEEGALIASQGGSADKLDPNLKNTYVIEAGLSVDRELVPNFGLHVGYVWRGIRQMYGVYNSARPFDSFNVPVQIPDPGPDGVVGNADDGPSIAGWNLDPSIPSSRVTNLYTNSDDKLNYHNIEVSANRRMAGRWSLMAAFAVRFNADSANSYFGNTVRQNGLVRTKNDLINADSDGLYHFTTYNFKFNSIIEGPWGVRITPMIRFQAGQPWGRTFSYTTNYGSINILAEPLNSRRQDNLVVVDSRTEKVFRLPNNRSVSAFFDIYNITNSNAEQNINYASGSRFNFPSTIIAPRIVRFGLKMSW